MPHVTVEYQEPYKYSHVLDLPKIEKDIPDGRCWAGRHVPDGFNIYITPTISIYKKVENFMCMDGRLLFLTDEWNSYIVVMTQDYNIVYVGGGWLSSTPIEYRCHFYPYKISKRYIEDGANIVLIKNRNDVVKISYKP